MVHDVPVIGADAAFYVVFGAFVVAFAVLSVITVRWALQRDRTGRAQWVRRQQERQGHVEAEVPPPTTNGQKPPDRTAGRRETPG
jgi:hypothetical protein